MFVREKVEATINASVQAFGGVMAEGIYEDVATAYSPDGLSSRLIGVAIGRFRQPLDRTVLETIAADKGGRIVTYDRDEDCYDILFA